jgi:hypothetical protein
MIEVSKAKVNEIANQPETREKAAQVMEMVYRLAEHNLEEVLAIHCSISWAMREVIKQDGAYKLVD